ncbi:MAG: hypothetical protein BWX99_01033 [Deltaproteobacteria bacterium ADurb.Bin151]|nr:MAG: hypothetical protein BWX99_01033 [Deltaproteobacteria bacterium ADurb.Bin151]
MLAGGLEHGRADGRATAVLVDVLFVFLAEIADGAQNRIGSCLPQAAQGRIFDNGGHFLEQFDVARLAFSVGNVGQNVQHAFGAFAAGGALAAGFILAEVHEEPGHVDRALVFVHDDQSAGTHDGAEFRDFFIVNGSI